MKYLVVSDIHGSAFYCQKFLEIAERQKPDQIIILGDILYHGPRNDLPYGYNPKKVIEMLNSHKDIITSVRGNCDAEVDQMVLAFPIMADYKEFDIGHHHYCATHGHLDIKTKIPPLKDGDILLCGHTHIDAFEKRDGYYYMNPGSISIPKSNYHSYIMIEDDNVYFMDLSGNVFRKVTL